mmetsp:Transcript_20811/g.57302  ORF Transcript_20811/g.57302 Transcript_20811/m.57302 type:complete len:141 (-) Transcript_20811:322-744(-)
MQNVPKGSCFTSKFQNFQLICFLRWHVEAIICLYTTPESAPLQCMRICATFSCVNQEFSPKHGWYVGDALLAKPLVLNGPEDSSIGGGKLALILLARRPDADQGQVPVQKRKRCRREALAQRRVPLRLGDEGSHQCIVGP